MRLANFLEAVTLDQLDDPPKPGFHVERESFDLFSNAIIE